MKNKNLYEVSLQKGVVYIFEAFSAFKFEDLIDLDHSLVRKMKNE